MFCTNCGQQLGAGSRFCSACGTRVSDASGFEGNVPPPGGASEPPPPPAGTYGAGSGGPPPPPFGSARFAGFAGGMVRPRSPRMVAGVCAAIALRYGWDLAIVRILTVLFCLFWGTGILAYLVCWLVIPEGQYALPAKSV